MMGVAFLLVATFVVSLSLTGSLAAPGAWFRILDTPNARSLHATALPRTGGVAILGAFVFGLAASVAAARFQIGGTVLTDAAHVFRSRDVEAIVAAALL